MKKLTVISCIFFIALNTVAYLIFSKYELFNNVLVSFSIFSSALMVYVLSNKKNADSYIISFSFVFSFLGLMKVLISFFSKTTFTDNFSILWVLLIIFVEIFFLFLIDYMKKNAQNQKA